MRELRRGDRAAFSQLYRAFAQPLYARVLLPKLGDADAAQDALAETFRIMLEKLNQYEDRGGSIWSWLATIAANQARDVARARERAGRALRNFETQWAPLLEPLMPDDDERRRRTRRPPQAAASATRRCARSTRATAAR